MKILIKNAKIITPDEILENHGLVIVDGLISKINLEIELLKDKYDKIIDGNNRYLSPGFVDIHNHGNSGYDIMDGTTEALDNISKFHLQNGVTSYLGTIITSSIDNIENAIDNINRYKVENLNTNLIGVHLEGPFFNPRKKGAQPEKYIIEPDINILKNILSKTKLLKMVSMAPELPNLDNIYSLLNENNIAIAMGHSNGSYKDTKYGIEHGITIATHLYNGMRELNHREPGIVGAALEDNRVYCELIYDRVHLHDAIVNLTIRLKGRDKIILVSDAMRATGLEDGLYELGGQKVIVKNKIARLESGSLAGSLLTLNRAVYNLVKYLDIDLVDAIKMASLNPARAIRENHIGSLELNKDADIIFIDDEVNIYGLILKGKDIWLEK